MNLYLQLSFFIIAYLLGSIPFGYVLTKLAGYGDIRAIGSGNIGATNVLRTGNKILAFFTLLLDGGKGAVGILLTQQIFPEIAPMVGLLILIGHLFPVWLDFKGGKGVATAVGILLGLAWPVGLAVMGIWCLIAFATRTSSLAALIAIGLAPAFVIAFGEGEWMWMSVCMMMLIVSRHGDNIKRLLAGNEPKIGASLDH